MSDNELYGDSVYEGGTGDPDEGGPNEGAEILDPVESLTGNDPDEIEQTRYDPPDREPYHLRHIPTALEEQEGRPLDDRLAEEQPDVTPEDVPLDDVPDPRAGRLIAPDEGGPQDTEKDEIAEDVGPAGYASSAEEAAVHIIDPDEVTYE